MLENLVLRNVEVSNALAEGRFVGSSTDSTVRSGMIDCFHLDSSCSRWNNRRIVSFVSRVSHLMFWLYRESITCDIIRYRVLVIVRITCERDLRAHT